MKFAVLLLLLSFVVFSAKALTSPDRARKVLDLIRAANISHVPEPSTDDDLHEMSSSASSRVTSAEDYEKDAKSLSASGQHSTAADKYAFAAADYAMAALTYESSGAMESMKKYSLKAISAMKSAATESRSAGQTVSAARYQEAADKAQGEYDQLFSGAASLLMLDPKLHACVATVASFILFMLM